MKLFFYLHILLSISLQAQQAFKIKKEDNRFLFFQKGAKNDTLIKNKTDLFYIKLPDSLSNELEILVQNGQLIKQYDSLYKLIFVNGMSYSHKQHKQNFTTLLEGAIMPKKQIVVSVKNCLTKKSILTNRFIVK